MLEGFVTARTGSAAYSPTEATMLRVTLHTLLNATQAEQTLARRAVSVLTTVVNDTRFLERIRAGPYSSTLRVTDDNQLEDASNDTVAEIIVGGKESQQSANGTLDLVVALEALQSGAAAVVFPPDPLIRTDAKFFAHCLEDDDPLSVASLWMHEWMHVAGFCHPTSGERSDVPYVVGDIVEALGGDSAVAPPGEALATRARNRRANKPLDDWICPVTLEHVLHSRTRA
jgi:hypothetical protein